MMISIMLCLRSAVHAAQGNAVYHPPPHKRKYILTCICLINLDNISYSKIALILLEKKKYH